MKKAGIFAAVIAVVLLLMQFYNYRLVGYTDDAMYVIDETRALKNLKNGGEEGESLDLVLQQYGIAAPLYSRGDRLFLGEEYDALNEGYPVYVNDGNYLYSFSDEMNLITSDFTVLNTYYGMYVADGHSYNQGRELADPDEFIFVENSDGLFFNVQDMTIQSAARSGQIPVNSLLYLTRDAASWYEFQDGRYVYRQYRDVLSADVTVGSVTMPYSQLVERLTGEKEEEITPAKEAEKEAETEPIPESSLAEETEKAGEEGFQEESAGTAGETASGAGEGAGSETAVTPQESLSGSISDTEQGAGGAEAGNRLEPLHPPIPSDKDGWRFPNGKEEGDSDSGQDGSGDHEAGNGSQNQGGQDSSGQGQGEDGGSGEGENGDLPFEKPHVEVKNFQFSVYSATADLTIENPMGTAMKGVRLIFYKEGETRASYRKLYRTPGKITASPLEPDTRYEVEGYFDYQHPQYGKQREVFLERAYCGKTLPISALTPMVFYQTADEGALAPHSIQLKDIRITDAAATASPSDAEKLLSAMQYLSTVQLRFEKKGVPDWNGPETAMASSLVSRLKQGETVVWKTADFLDSNSWYRYQITLYDRYGNELPVKETGEEGASTSGEIRTCMEAPQAKLTFDRDNTINRTGVTVKIENPDQVKFQGKLRLYVTYSNMPETAVPFLLEGEDEERTEYEFDGKKTPHLVFKSFLPSTVYTIWVRGSYDLNDGKVYQDEVLGSAATTTGSLLSLGSVNFELETEEIAHSSVSIRTRIRSAISENLYSFVSRLDFTLGAKGEEKPRFSVSFDREELKTVTIQPGGIYTLRTPSATEERPSYDPEITVFLPASSVEKTVWDALLTDGAVTVCFQQDGLSSATDFEAEMRAKAVRGSSDDKVVEEDVTGRYHKTSFKTMKQPTSIGRSQDYINGSAASFYEPWVEDPDQAVLGGRLVLRLRNDSNNALLEVRTVTVEEINAMETLRFGGLEENTAYRLEFVASEYNEGYTSATREVQKLLDQWKFTAKNTLYGSMTLDSINSDFEEQKEDEVGIGTINLFDVNTAEIDHTVNGNGVVESANNLASDFIAVEEGKLYVLGGGIGNQIAQYDENKNYKSIAAAGSAERNLYYRPGAGVRYIRVGTSIANSSASFVSPALHWETDSSANRMKGVSIKEGCYLETDGTVKNTNVNVAVTEFVLVESGRPLIRMDFSQEGDTGWQKMRICFYDEKKQFLLQTTATPWMGVITAPEGASFARFGLNPDYADQMFVGVKADYGNGINLLEKDVTWVPSMFVNERNQYSPQTIENNQYCEYVRVKPLGLYYISALSGVQVFDEDKSFLGYFPSGMNYIRMPEKAAYIRANVYWGETHSAKPMLCQMAPSQNPDSIDVGVRVVFEDPDGRLGKNSEFLLEITKIRNGDETETVEEVYQVDADRRKFDQVIELDHTSPDCRYEIRQIIILEETRIVLSELCVEPSSSSRIIKSEAGLRSVYYNPMGDYMVVRDIEVKHFNSMIAYFYGTMDFQGHRLTMENRRTLIANLFPGAQLENLEAVVVSNSLDAAVANVGLVVTQNRGTMQNIVLKIAMDNHKNNQNFGGLCHINYGIIDGFAIQMTGNVCAPYQFGLAACSNYGQISNGYLVSSDAFRLTMEPDSAGQYYRGGLVGIHYDGVLKNLYSAAVMESLLESVDNRQGLIVGEAKNEVRNVFSVGEVLHKKASVPAATSGPAVGQTSSYDKMNNVNYVETMGFAENRYANAYNNRVNITSLWDQAWIDGAVNAEGRFDTSMVQDGFYPQLRMPSCMDGRQPVVMLPSRDTAPVKLLSNTVLEQSEDRALVRFYFENRTRQNIKALELATMDMKSGERIYRTGIANTTVVNQGVDEEERYFADVEVSEPSQFRSKYYVNKFTAGVKGNAGSDFDVEEDPKDKMEVAIEFYQDIHTVEEWRQKVSSDTADMYGNYRLKAKELDFGNLSDSDYKTQYRLRRDFYGKIDGQWTDEDGRIQTAVLKNIHLDGAYSSFIGNLYGTICNVNVENLRINTEKTSQETYTGLILQVIGGTVDHVQIRSSEVCGGGYTGILTGAAKDGAVVQNSSVKDCRLTSFSYSKNMKSYLGGLVGYVGNAKISNCYVQNLMLDNMDALDTAGVGGIVGYSDLITMANCYATGEIQSAYRNVGGLIGNQNSSASEITGCYARVHIDAYGNFIGGLIGRLGGANYYRNMEGNLSLGNLFVHTTGAEGVHRIVGYPAEGRYSKNFGYEQQMVNNRVDSGNQDDADEVLTAAELGSEATYRGRLGWSSAYALSWEQDGASYGIGSGYLPMLCGTDGEILPGQDPVPFGGGEMSLKVADFKLNSKAEQDCRELFGHGKITQAYRMIFTLVYDESKYQVARLEDGGPAITMAGMNLNSRGRNSETGEMVNGYRVQEIADPKSQQWDFPLVETELGGDIYCLSVVLQSLENPDVTVTLSATATPNGGSAIEIGNVEQWNQTMEKYGNTYGNFVLTGDIDFTNFKGKLVTGLKINSLTSKNKEKPCTIRGIEHEVSGAREAFIGSCLSGISDVKFENCSWTVPEDKKEDTFENIGLIGMNQGTIERVSFTDITVESGRGNYTGCIGYNLGLVQDVTAERLQVSGENYVGGLAGYSLQPMRRIKATGNLKKVKLGEDDPYQEAYTSDYLVCGRVSVGGIVGSGRLSDKTEATGIKVFGTRRISGNTKSISSIGGAIGEGGFDALGQTVAENNQMQSLVANCFVTAEEEMENAAVTNIGGVAGSGWSQKYVQAKNLEVRCDTATNVGGVVGSGGSEYARIWTEDDGTYAVKKTVVRGLEKVGGITGYQNASNCVADRITVEALRTYAGGAVGFGGTNAGNLIDRVTVTAPTGAGGVSGKSNASPYNNLVSRSVIETTGPYVGGVTGMGVDNEMDFYGNGVIHTKVTAGINQKTGESFAGGLIGMVEKPRKVYGNYTRSVKVTSEGDCVGGLIGAAAGGLYEQNYSDNETVVEGREAVGGFVGRMTGNRSQGTGERTEMVFQNSYNFNTVRGADCVGGLFGLYLPGTGGVMPDASNFRGLLMMGAVEQRENTSGAPEASGSDLPDGTGSGVSCRADFFYNLEDSSQSGDTGAWGGQSLRLFTEASLLGIRAAEKYPAMEYLKTYRTESLGNSSVPDTEANVAKLTSALFVTQEDLLDNRTYSVAYEKGGMNWSTGWNLAGIGRMDTETETTTTYKPSVDVIVRKADGSGERTISAADKKWAEATDLLVEEGENRKYPVAAMPEGASNYYWYRTYTVSGSAYVTISSNQIETPMAGRGYYFGRCIKDGKYLYTPVIKMDTDPYMPYITTGAIWSRGAQEGFPPEIGTTPEADERLWQVGDAYEYLGYSGLDQLFYGGVVIPESQETQEALLLEQGDQSPVLVYPSSADTVNVELGTQYGTLTGLTVTSGGRTLCDTVPDRRVYTLDYDYRSPVTVTLTVGTASQSVTVDTSELRRTVLVAGDQYYYTSDGRLMSGDGVTLEEEIIHLFGTEALSVDGRVYDLKTGEAREISGEPWSEESETKAFWADGELRSFGAFTEIAKENETLIQEQQLVRKNGKLYALSGGQSLRGMALDDYNGEVYASFLNEEGMLKDLADGLHTPEGFNRRGIAHMSSTLDADAPYLLVRYANGAAKGFNYVTGEELPVENAYSDVSFLDFAAGFADEFFGGSGTGSVEFADLKKLQYQLTLAPITDSQLSEAVNRLSRTEEGVPETGADDAGTGTAVGDGSSEGRKDGSEGPGDLPAESAGKEDFSEKEESAAHETKWTEAEENTKSEDVKSEDVKAEEAKAEDANAADAQAKEAKAEDVKADDAKADDIEAESEKEKGENAEAGNGKASLVETGSATQGTSGAAAGETSEAAAGETSREDQPAKMVTYAYAFQTADGTSHLYNMEDLLNRSAGELMDEEEKLELLKSAGIATENYIVTPKDVKEQSRRGMIIFAGTVLAAIGLSILLIRRKKRYDG